MIIKNKITNREIMDLLVHQQKSIDDLTEKVDKLSENMAQKSVERLINMLNNNSDQLVKGFKSRNIDKLTDKINDFIALKPKRRIEKINFYSVVQDDKPIQFAMVTYVEG